MSEASFQELYDYLKKSLNSKQLLLPEKLIPEGPWLYRLQEETCRNAIKIMESNIFIKGRLKDRFKKGIGFQRLRKKPEITDLNVFIFKISYILALDSFTKSIPNSQAHINDFLHWQTLQAFYHYSNWAISIKGIHKSKINSVRNRIEKLKQEFKEIPNNDPIVKNWAAKQITLVFKTHVPKATIEIIPHWVESLLTVFGIEAKAETIRDWLKNNKKLPPSFFSPPHHSA